MYGRACAIAGRRAHRRTRPAVDLIYCVIVIHSFSFGSLSFAVGRSVTARLAKLTPEIVHSSTAPRAAPDVDTDEDTGDEVGGGRFDDFDINRTVVDQTSGVSME